MSSTRCPTRLYLARFAFAIAWAGTFAFSATTISPFSGTVLYPVLNMALGLLTAVGLALAAALGTRLPGQS